MTTTFLFSLYHAPIDIASVLQEKLKDYSIIALSLLLKNREALFEDGRLIKSALTDHTEIDAELQKLTKELEIVAHMIENTIATNAITALDQDEYAETYESLTERYTTLQKRYTTLTRQREDKQFKADELG